MAKIQHGQLCILRWASELWKPGNILHLDNTTELCKNSSMFLCESDHSQFAQITTISVIYLYFPTRKHLLKTGVSNHQPCQFIPHSGSKATYFISSASCLVTLVLQFRLFTQLHLGNLNDFTGLTQGCSNSVELSKRYSRKNRIQDTSLLAS